MTRHRELELDPDVRRGNPLIAETMQHVAHIPIRNRGTVVGSLCHADPSAEMPLLFVLLDGTFVAQGPDGTRHIPAEQFFQSFLTTARRQDEIVVEARLPVLPAGAGWAFDEVTRRHGDYALVGVGCVLELDGRRPRLRCTACGLRDCRSPGAALGCRDGRSTARRLRRRSRRRSASIGGRRHARWTT